MYIIYICNFSHVIETMIIYLAYKTNIGSLESLNHKKFNLSTVQTKYCVGVIFTQ